MAGRGTILGIQVARATAAMMVVLDHSVQHTLRYEDNRYISEIRLFDYIGTFGVCIFFVISGYIMLATNERFFSVPGASQNFVLRRFLRIAPVYYVGTAFAAAALTVVGFRFSIGDIASSLLFVGRYSHIETQGFFPVLGVGWTLNLEMFFYALFSFALLLRKRKGQAFVLITLASIVITGYLARKTDYINTHSLLFFYTTPLIGLFAVGIIIRIVERRAKIDPAGRGVDLSVPICLSFLFPSLVFTCGLQLDRPLHETIFYGGAIVCTILFAVSKTSRQFAKPILFLGDASYSIYIFHSVIILMFVYGVRNFRPGNEIAIATAAFTAATLGSVLMYLLVEKRLRVCLEFPLRSRFERVALEKSAETTATPSEPAQH